MTIRVGQNAQGKRTRAMQRSRIPAPPSPVKTVTRQGIERKAAGRKPRELAAPSDRYEAILALLDTETPASPTTIGKTLGLKRDGVTSSLYALQARGLVMRIPYKGWLRVSQLGAWREVPCGHPPDPVAMRTQADILVCHCGWIVDEDGPLIQQCSKCGCHVAKHVPTAAELEAFRG